MLYREKLIFPSGGESNYRIPSLIVTADGTVLAFCNDRKHTVRDHATDTVLVYARKEPGKEWSEPIALMEHEGICCLIGSAVYDRETDTAIVFARRKIARYEFGTVSDEEAEKLEAQDRLLAAQMGLELGDFQFSSTDSGKNWTLQKVVQEPLSFLHKNGKTYSVPMSTHGGAHGIQLRHGAYRGRLLCPSRIFAGVYQSWEEIRDHVYNNAVYSDDHGKSWRISHPVQLGTGEGTLIELENGEILYNSRAYFGDSKRYLAKSCDGGEHYTDAGTDPFLREEKRIGCNASFLRVERRELCEKDQALLPDSADSVTLFVNPRADTRCNMTVCVSFDSGESWVKTKTVYERASAYSSLDYSSAGGCFHLLYEKGEEKPYSLGLAAAEFDLEWILS